MDYSVGCTIRVSIKEADTVVEAKDRSAEFFHKVEKRVFGMVAKGVVNGSLMQNIKGTEYLVEWKMLGSYVKLDRPVDDSEKRVYVISAANEKIDGMAESAIMDHLFISLAEEEGRVYSLDGFVKAYNAQEEFSDSVDFIRIL